jgi:2-methylcitrate dehydratase
LRCVFAKQLSPAYRDCGYLYTSSSWSAEWSGWFRDRHCKHGWAGFFRARGWHHATFTAFVSPIVAGRTLHLPWEQIQHAIGISASVRACFGVVAAGKLTMMKNTASPMGTERGALAALMASEGYTGPEHIIDGKEGLVHVFGPEWKLNLLTDGLGQSWRITQCGMKFFPAEALTHAPISATLDLITRLLGAFAVFGVGFVLPDNSA